MSKTSIKITINNKEYSYDFAKFGFYALCTAEKEYGLNPLELENNPMSTILSLFAFVAGMDVDKAGAEIGVLCRAYKGGNPYQSSFTADTGTYRLCADKVVCKRVYEVERILLN